MDYQSRLEISYYKTIATINEEHRIYIAQHSINKSIVVKKILDVYNIDVYETLKASPIKGIPAIIDFCEDDGQLILIEEYIQGTSFDEIIEQNSLTKNDIKAYIESLCNILKALHSMTPPIVHRDLKPSNIILDKYGNMFLLDFNAAKQYKGSNSSDTVLIGTQGYAAPEQYGFGSSSPRTDIYSVGVILKELCDKNKIGSVYNDVIETCMKISPDERYLNVDDIIRGMNGKRPRRQTLEPIDFIPPGFRSKKPWKMIVSVLGYAFIIWSGCGLTTNPPSSSICLLIDKIFYILCCLSVVAVTCNYMDILQLMPLCNSNNKVIYHIGKWLLGFIIIFLLVLIMVFVQSPFS